jgi:two-component system, response regulator PdtaR
VPSVLIVEDESLTAESLKASVRRLGCSATIVSSGEEAIEQARAGHLDVIFMDLTLRGAIDGVESARRIRDQRSIPIVFLTAHTDPATSARIAAIKPQGYQGHMVKPYSEEELKKTLERALEQPVQ